MGTSADCVDAFRAGVECRPASGGCDPAEVCSGGAPSCPPNQVHPVGTVCHASTGSCDPAESCDGTAAACPPDVTNSCTVDAAAGVDASIGGDSGAPPRDASASLDASANDASANDASTGGADASGPPPATAGCSCRVARGTDGSAAALGVLLVLAIVVARRRRHPGRQSGDRSDAPRAHGPKCRNACAYASTGSPSID